MEIINKYFPKLSPQQNKQFEALQGLYSEWNERINVVSRKDIENLYERHILHSLAIAKVMEFAPQTAVLDVGCGGGFPGIPLAILFPDCTFHLIDAIAKKITVVNAVAQGVGLKNVCAEQIRAENVKQKYDFVISRAVCAFPEFVRITKHVFLQENKNPLPNGILYLKGGDLREELQDFPDSQITPINTFFDEAFFETKAVVYHINNFSNTTTKKAKK